MIIYKDIITDNEMISDSYDLKEIDGVVYEADCAMIEVGGINVDIGANASAEEPEEALDDGKVRVNNIIDSFRLQNIPFDKKGYVDQLKSYLKKIEKHLREEQGLGDKEVTEWRSALEGYLKKTVLAKGKFEEWDFYMGETAEGRGMVALLNYREDGITPYFVFIKHGLKGMKV